MFISLSAMVPNADDLLALEPEEIAGVLLSHLNSYGNQTSIGQGRIHQYNFFNELNQHPPYPGHQEEVNRVLMEAWNWLEGEGLLVKDAAQSSANSFFLSRRARQLTTRDDLVAFRKSSLLPKGQLHPLISVRVYPAFLRGEYDTAVFQAFREVEIAVRKAGAFADEDLGVPLMRSAFRPKDSDKTPGPLADTTVPVAEQQAMANLFCGAIGLYKNPQSHRYVPTEALDAAEIIVFASHLLRMIDGLRN